MPPPAKIGPYEILGSIGSGGMGEVYKAKDTRLNREVAIKISHEKFSDRFDREARAIASLNHPNICTVHDVGPNYLVMELIDGQTLAEKLKDGPLPFEEAIRIASQIAEALEAAHDKAIIHRDLKPGNIKIKSDGTVKVLDFGLAKFTAPKPASDETETMGRTETGVIVGTAHYMSPEQARGGAVDKRSDIFAFGAVLYEMLSARRAFNGTNVSEIIASILKDEPDYAKVPVQSHRLLKRCLEKDASRRLNSARDMDLLLSLAESKPGKLPWLVAAAAIAIAAFLALRPGDKPKPAPLRAFSFPVESLASHGGYRRAVISPNGKYIVYSAANKLWLRDLASEQPRPIPGTENGQGPFWSPDSAQIGFAVNAELKRIRLDGATPLLIAKLPAEYRGGAWSPDGNTVLVSGAGIGLLTVTAEGGTLRRVAAGATFYAPSFATQNLVIAAKGTMGAQTIEAVDLEKGTSTSLRQGGYPFYAPSGHILFQTEPREPGVWALPFNPANPAAPAEAVPLTNEGADISASIDGTLAASDLAGFRAILNFAWRDRSGKRSPIDPPLIAAGGGFALSPDGLRVAYTEKASIWIQDLRTGARTSVSAGGDRASSPRWSANGAEIAFGVASNAENRIVVVDLTRGGSPETIVTDTVMTQPDSWTPDGGVIVFLRMDPVSSGDLWTVSRGAGGKFGKPQIYLKSEFNEQSARVSPDGRFVAYSSNATGRTEIYVNSFPGGAIKRQVTSSGGAFPSWRADGKEIYFNNFPDNAVYAMPVDLSNGVSAGVPVKLFAAPTGFFGRFNFASTYDGKRFLCAELPSDGAKPTPIHVIQNWMELLKK